VALTADEVARRAASSSFEVEVEEQQRAAARAGVDQANAGYYPRLTASARYTRLSDLDTPALGNVVLAPGADPGPIDPGTTLVAAPLGFPQLLDQYALQAQLSVPLSDYLLRVPHAVDAAAASEKAAALDARAARLRVATDARILYYSWVRSRLQLTVTEQTLAQTRAHHLDAQRLAAAGVISQADVLRAEAQVAESELLLERARNLAQLNEQRLRTSMHDVSGARYEIGEGVEGAAPAAPPPADVSELARQAFARRLELAALAQNQRGLHAQADLSRAAQLPRLDGLAEATYANPNQRIVPQQGEFTGSWSLGVALSWTPSDIPGSFAQARAAEARASAIEAQRRGLQDAIRIEIARALQAQSEAGKAIDTSERRLRAAEEAYRVRTALFQNGRASGVELTDAEVELTRARLDAVAARVGLRVAGVELAHAAGLDVKE
jgi:outer membrane protein TolC